MESVARLLAEEGRFRCRTLSIAETRSMLASGDEQNATHHRVSTDRVRLMREEFAGSSIRLAWVDHRASLRSNLVTLVRQADALRSTCKRNTDVSHRRLARRERSLPSLVHAVLVAALEALKPWRTKRGSTSTRATRRGCSHPQIVSSRSDRHSRVATTARYSTRIYCGRSLTQGSSSSDSTCGVGRVKGLLKFFSPSVIVSLCWILSVVSIMTSSLSEILVT